MSDVWFHFVKVGETNYKTECTGFFIFPEGVTVKGGNTVNWILRKFWLEITNNNQNNVF